MKGLKLLVIASLLSVCACRPTSKDETPTALRFPKEATELFDRYVALQAQFDPALADLYADDAVIKNTRRYPDQTTREMSLPAPAYKELLRNSMEKAKARGDTNQYSGILSQVEDGKLRFTAVRYSDLKRYYSPVSLLVAKRGERWLIVEELTESVGVSLNPPIRELKLLDGRILKGVWVTSIGPDHLTARWQGGRGVIPFDVLPDDYREAATRPPTPRPAQDASPANSKPTPKTEN